MRTVEEMQNRISYISGVIKGLELATNEDAQDIDRIISDYNNLLLGLQWSLNINDYD